MESLLRHVITAATPAAIWGAVFSAVVIAVFVLYVGIAMAAVLRTEDERIAEIRYRVFCDLVELFRRQGRQ